MVVSLKNHHKTIKVATARLLLQDFAPPKPLVDLLIEQSPKLAVKLWAKVGEALGQTSPI